MLPAALRQKQCKDWKPVHAFVALQPPPILSNTSKLCTHFRILADKILWTLQIYSMYFLHFLQGVQDSTVIPLHCTVCTPSRVKKNVNTDLQWFTVTSTLLHCNVYGKYILVTCTLFYGCSSFHCIYLQCSFTNGNI